MSTKTVVHRNGSIEIFKTEEIIKAIQYLFDWTSVSDQFVMMFKIIKNFELKMPDQITTSDIDQLLLKSIEWLISEDSDYDILATRQLIKIIDRQINQRFQSFSEYIKYGVELGILDKRMLNFDLGTLELSINYQNDNLLNYFWLATLRKNYLVKNYEWEIIEKPQWMRMRVAMWVSLLETDKEAFAISVYDQLSQLKYIHSTPTLYNAGHANCQLSSCYISVVEDSMESIMGKASEAAQFAKFAGGIGMSATKLRASGSHIKGINWASSWPIPFLKMYDTVINAIMQWGKRRSSMVIYMEPRHYNFEEFLDLKETNGNDYVRTRNLNTACWMPDEFMQRVVDDADRYMFDPKECPELTESRWEDFSKWYNIYIDKADKWELKTFKILKAQYLYRESLTRAAKTGNYWINFKDTFNRLNPAKEYSMIHSSNLCTEIWISNTEKSTAVCTLASLNLSKYLKSEFKSVKYSDLKAMTIDRKLELVDKDELTKVIKIAIQALDNIVDVNFYPSPEAEINSKDMRPIGLWVMWFGELLLKLDICYDSPEANKLSDYLWSHIYSTALAKSQEIASIKWPFRDYNVAKYPYPARRNTVMLAIAPTASISNIAGTSSGIEPFYSNIYSRETLHGKFTIVVQDLVDTLKAQNLRSEDIRTKILSAQWSIQWLSELSENINLWVYKTVYESSPNAQVDIAASRQKYVDQAISRNLYCAENYRDKLFDIYMYARKQWLKSTYYCFIEKNIQWEKYTQDVNKRWVRTWFGWWANKWESVENTSNNNSQNNLQNQNSLTSQAPAKRWFWHAKTEVTEEVVYWWMTKSQIEAKLIAEKWDEYVAKLKRWELYEGACPVNPFEAVMCEACQ
jgi:ribonucleoside-diphosphate reductase alpha chain